MVFFCFFVLVIDINSFPLTPLIVSSNSRTTYVILIFLLASSFVIITLLWILSSIVSIKCQ
eukprot:m.219125 g.219125  ORF g.219125 m.219125 type:complete len:61 (+) comp16996_c5_seq1:70-252(+)